MRIEDNKDMAKLKKFFSKDFDQLETKIVDFLYKRRILTNISTPYGASIKELARKKNMGSSTLCTKLFGNVPPDVKEAFENLRLYSSTPSSEIITPRPGSGTLFSDVTAYFPTGESDKYVKITGDTMTGPLSLIGATAGTHAVNRDTGDARYVLETGDTMTGNLILDQARLGLAYTAGEGVTNSDLSWIYTTGGGGAAYPHDAFGHLVIQPRTSESRDIVFITGSAIRAMIKGDGTTEFNGIVKNQSGSAYFESNFSTGNGNYTHAFDDAGTRGYIMRSYAIDGIQLALDAGGIDRALTLGTTDFSGTGWQGDDEGNFNIYNLVVRGSARFRELIIDQLSIIAGSQLLSVARGKVKSISGNTITLEDPNNKGVTRFAVGDFFWIKTVDIDGALFSDIRGQVSAITGITLTLDLTVTGANGAMADISPGDVIAQRGHPTLTARQNMIYTTVSDTDSPVEKYLTGINTLAAFDVATNIRMQLGNMSTAPSVGGVTPSGFGLYADNAYLEGTIVANSGLIAGWEINADSISKESGSSKAELSSANQELAFSQDGAKRALLKSGLIEPFGALNAATVPRTSQFALNETHNLSGVTSYNHLSGSFPTTISGQLTSRIRIMYTVGLAANIDASISGTIYLTDNAGNTLETLGTFSHTYTEINTYIDYEVDVAVNYYAIGTYRIRVQGSITDNSTDLMSDPSPGTTTIGGTTSDHRSAITTPDGVMRTEVGYNGMFSYWGPDRFFYMHSSGFQFIPMGVKYNLGIKGNMRLMSSTSDYSLGADGCAIELYSDFMRIEGNDIRFTNLPTSSSGLSPGNIYMSGGYLRIVQ